MDTPLPEADVVAAFAHLAEDFCALVERRDVFGRNDLLRAVHVRLAPLYAAALALPTVETLDEIPEEVDDVGVAAEKKTDVDVSVLTAQSSQDRLTGEEWMALYRFLGTLIGEVDLYAEVFDPYAQPPKEPVTASLADDIADIYRDLADGIAKWRRGEKIAACREWRLHFTTHWGEHATSALRALHALAADHELGFPGR